MARIVVVTSAPPLVEGGHLVIARALVQALTEAGHEAGLVTTPSHRFGRQGTEYLATWLTDVRMSNGQPVDHVISLRYPSYAVRHPSHVCWLNHTMREYYDLWDDFRSRLSPRGRLKEGARRRLIHAADTWCFRRHVTRLYAQSRTVQARLQRWNGVPSQVLYPPAPPRPYRCDAYEPFIFVVSRLAPLKRIDLILHALATPQAREVRCVIAGEGEAGADLRALTRALELETRVSFVGRISDGQLVDYLARCRAVCFVPKQEDYGFVTVEAFASSKAVVTTSDSGGPAELVVDGANGRVVAPEAGAIGAALVALMADPAQAERLGQHARETAAALQWSDVARTLACANARRPASRSVRST